MEPREYQTMRESEDRHWWYAGLHDLILGLVERETSRQGRALDILDAGCGTGRLCQLLAPHARVHGLDFSPLAVEAARGRGLRHIRQGDLTATDLGESCLDVITCLDVLCHRAVPDEGNVLARFHRALRPGGLLLIQLPAFAALRGSHDAAVHSVRRYRRSDVRVLLDAAGFRVEFVTFRLLPLFLPLLVWRWSTRALPQRIAGNGVASDVVRSSFGPLNALLAAAVFAENSLLLRGLRLPFGTSVVALARK